MRGLRVIQSINWRLGFVHTNRVVATYTYDYISDHANPVFV